MIVSIPIAVLPGDLAVPTIALLLWCRVVVLLGTVLWNVTTANAVTRISMTLHR